MDTYTVISYSNWCGPQVESGLSKEYADALAQELRDCQYLVEVMTDKEYIDRL